MTDNEQIIRDFIGAWSRLDSVELASYFTADGCYYNMPTQPVKAEKTYRNLSRALSLTGPRPIGKSCTW